MRAGRYRFGGPDAVLDVGDRRGQGADRVGDVGRGTVDRIQQALCLTQRRFTGADGVDQGSLTVGGLADQSARGGDVLVGERQPLSGAVHVAGHRSQRGFRELAVQPVEGLLGRLDACGQDDHLLGQRVQSGRRVDDQVAHLMERGASVLQFLVGAGRRDDHLGQQVAALLRRLGHGVVERLAHAECLCHGGFRVL
ncbi:Uncharacterised protein [Mycobacteroides abscessus subsp. abscessus]|nr:Uncharacterised protein [Mycobacteroides abscessus subsp. abscessus]